ncbi:MAG: hypothetical protein AAB089_04465 [Nitrospirota bacterium]
MFGIRSKGQSALEYVILIGFVVSALIAMGVYIKRGVQGRLRESTDQVGEQYSAWHTSSEYTTNSHTDQRDRILGQGETVTEFSTEPGKETYQKKWGNEEIKGYDDEKRSQTEN